MAAVRLPFSPSLSLSFLPLLQLVLTPFFLLLSCRDRASLDPLLSLVSLILPSRRRYRFSRPPRAPRSRPFRLRLPLRRPPSPCSHPSWSRPPRLRRSYRRSATCAQSWCVGSDVLYRRRDSVGVVGGVVDGGSRSGPIEGFPDRSGAWWACQHGGVLPRRSDARRFRTCLLLFDSFSDKAAPRPPLSPYRHTPRDGCDGRRRSRCEVDGVGRG